MSIPAPSTQRRHARDRRANIHVAHVCVSRNAHIHMQVTGSPSSSFSHALRVKVEGRCAESGRVHANAFIYASRAPERTDRNQFAECARVVQVCLLGVKVRTVERTDERWRRQVKRTYYVFRGRVTFKVSAVVVLRIRCTSAQQIARNTHTTRAREQHARISSPGRTNWSSGCDTAATMMPTNGTHLCAHTSARSTSQCDIYKNTHERVDAANIMCHSVRVSVLKYSCDIRSSSYFLGGVVFIVWVFVYVHSCIEHVIYFVGISIRCCAHVCVRFVVVECGDECVDKCGRMADAHSARNYSIRSLAHVFFSRFRIQQRDSKAVRQVRQGGDNDAKRRGHRTLLRRLV